jgi:hypothetical protein
MDGVVRDANLVVLTIHDYRFELWILLQLISVKSSLLNPS